MLKRTSLKYFGPRFSMMTILWKKYARLIGLPLIHFVVKLIQLSIMFSMLQTNRQNRHVWHVFATQYTA
jgi:hypothetical protein